MFLAENRLSIAQEAASNKASAVGKLAGEKWKKMTAEQKAPFEKRADEAKKAHEKAIEEYKAQGGQVGKRRQEKQEAKDAKASKAARKANQDPNKPKKPPTAYWMWMGENRLALMVESGKDVTKCSRLAGERWRGLSD